MTGPQRKVSLVIQRNSLSKNSRRSLETPYAKFSKKTNYPQTRLSTKKKV